MLRNFSENEAAELRWICDIDEARLAAMRRRYPAAQSTSDYQKVLSDPQLDAVAVVTPVATHFQITKEALLAGKHVLVEKPLTATSREAETLIELAEGNRCTLMVDHTFVYTGAVRKIHHERPSRLTMGKTKRTATAVVTKAPRPRFRMVARSRMPWARKPSPSIGIALKL